MDTAVERVQEATKMNRWRARRTLAGDRLPDASHWANLKTAFTAGEGEPPQAL